MPYTKRITVYSIDELDESAQEQAFINLSLELDYSGNKDNQDTLTAFENIFPVKVTKYEYGSNCAPLINFTFEEFEEITDLSGIRLLKYLWNNFRGDIYQGEYYFTGGGISKTSKHRRSKILLDSSCSLTGYCIDNAILQPIFDFMDDPDPSVTFYDLMYDCLQSWVIACSHDHEAFYSNENLIDIASINGYEFNEDGDLI